MGQFVLDKQESSLNLGVGIDIDEISAIEVENIEDVGIVCLCNVLHQFAVIQFLSVFGLASQGKGQQSWIVSFLFFNINHQIERHVDILTIDKLYSLHLLLP